MNKRKLAPIFILLAASCQSNLEYMPTVRLGTSIANDYSGSMMLSLPGYYPITASGDFDDASETTFAIGAKEIDPSSGAVNSLVEVVFSNPSLDGSGMTFTGTGLGYDPIVDLEFESSRIAFGGRYYTSDVRDMTPFLSIYTVIDDIEVTDTNGFLSPAGTSYNIGSQTSLSFGLGLEKEISTNGFIDASFNYLFPLSDAETVIDGVSYDTGFDGWSLNVGVGYSF